MAHAVAPGSKGKIVQGVIDLTFHHVAGAVLRKVLEMDGYEVEQVSFPHEGMYAKQQAGEVDIMLGWLEGSHGVYLDKYRERATVLNRFYEPYCFWGVPDFVPESEVAEIGDLAKPEVAGKFIKLIQGITPGAGISRFSKEAVEKYGLAPLGFHFQVCKESPKECFDAFEEAYAAGKPVVIPHYHPQYLHAKYKVRELKDPMNLMRGEVKDDCSPIILKSSVTTGRLQPSTVELLRRVYLSNAVVSQMDYYFCVDKMTPAEAAAKWMADNPETVSKWFTPNAFTPEERIGHLGIELPSSPGESKSWGGACEVMETPLLMPTLANGTLLTSETMIHTSTSIVKEQYEARKTARQCAINGLAAMKAAAEAAGGDLSWVTVQHVEGYLSVNSVYGTEDVMDEASNVFVDVMGDAGKHSRTVARLCKMLPSKVPVVLRVHFSIKKPGSS